MERGGADREGGQATGEQARFDPQGYFERMRRPGHPFRRTLGSPALFTIVYASLASALYFALAVVADHALGLTPVVFLIGGVFFVLCSMTYVEGASLHQDRGGATVFARYAFNELWSFVAGWAILLDYVILVAVCAFAAANYLGGAFWGRLSHGWPEFLVALAVIVFATATNVRGLGAARYMRIAVLTVIDLGLQGLLIVLGLVLVFRPHLLTDSIELGTAPTWMGVAFALTITTVAFTGLESASGLAGEVEVGRGGLKRLVGSSAVVSIVLYVGIAVVAITAMPVVGGRTALVDDYFVDPLVGVAANLGLGRGLSDALVYLVGAGGAITLVAAAQGAMLGLSRLAYLLATNRQIPSAVGRLHPTRSTPYVVIVVGAVLATALVIPLDLEFLVAAYAFGSLLAFTIAHLAVIALRYREPDRDRPYRIPGSVRFRGGSLPLPAVAGALLSFAGWASVLAFHLEASLLGAGWMAFGLVLYLTYRVSEGKPVFKRVTIPEQALRGEPPEAEFGSILVPVTGHPLDDDIIQTAGRLAAEDIDDEAEGGAVIEALWVFEIPMSLPIDAALPGSQLQRARQALARAKAVGEEYEGVEVATATVRARRAGEAIVDEARRRGVEVIVLAAEEPSRVRGGALLGGRGTPKENFVGELTKYVVTKAPCRVILTAPPSAEIARNGAPAPR
jgi:APA family basic amino acid/polyamine antiporter